MEHTWIVVADSSRARILSTRSRVKPPIDVEELSHPEGRMKAQELSTDRPGSTNDSHGDGRHGMEAQNLHLHHQEVFAKEIAENLEKSRNDGKYSQPTMIVTMVYLVVIRQTLDG